MSVIITVDGKEATLDGAEWTADDEELLSSVKSASLDYLLEHQGKLEYIPDKEIDLATFVAEKLDGKVTYHLKPTYEEGVIY